METIPNAPIINLPAPPPAWLVHMTAISQALVALGILHECRETVGDIVILASQEPGNRTPYRDVYCRYQEARDRYPRRPERIRVTWEGQRRHTRVFKAEGPYDKVVQAIQTLLSLAKETVEREQASGRSAKQHRDLLKNLRLAVEIPPAWAPTDYTYDLARQAGVAVSLRGREILIELDRQSCQDALPLLARLDQARQYQAQFATMADKIRLAKQAK